MSIPFSILNESNLHNSLKSFYAIQREGITEVKEDGFIYDLKTKDGEIFEIQTKNLSKIKNKITTILSSGKKLTVVHPIIKTNIIYTNDESGNLISKRKSTKKENILDIFSELTGIYPVLLDKNFTLEIIEISTIEQRIKTENPVYPKNKRARHKKDWYTLNKNLDEIFDIRIFKSKDDYLNILPPNTPEEFSSKILKQLLFNKDKVTRKEQKEINLLLWVLKKMELIEHIRTDKNSYIYKIK